MIKELNNENFEYVASTAKELYIIQFSSKTCGPCNTMKPVMEALAKNNPNIPVYQVKTDECPELASHFGIRAVPTIHYCENREIVYSFHGVTPLRDMQYVIDNINDPYFRETGEFKIVAPKKKYTFEIIVGLLILIFILAFAVASMN